MIEQEKNKGQQITIEAALAAIDKVSSAWGDVLPGETTVEAHRITNEAFGDNPETGVLKQIDDLIKSSMLTPDNQNTLKEELVTLQQTSPEIPAIKIKVASLIKKLG